MKTVHNLFIAFFVFILALSFSCKKPAESQATTANDVKEPQPSESVEAKTEEPKSESSSSVETISAQDKISVQLFVMSYCPFGITAENSIAKTLKALKDYVNFELHFVVSEVDGTIQSLHEQKEVDMNSVQICVGKVAPDKQMDFIVEFNKNTNQLWQDVAKKLNISEKAIKDCLDSGYGIKVQKEDAKLCKKLNVMGSPTLIIEGQQYQGKRSSKHFFDAFCQALEKKGKKPAVCDNPPDYLSYEEQPEQAGSCGEEGARLIDDRPYNLIIVYPEDALWPIEAQLKNLLEQTFTKATIERVSDKSPRGKELIAKTGIKRLPAVISTTPEFAKNKLVESGMPVQVLCKGLLCFLSPDSFGANYFLDLKPINDVFVIYYRADSGRVKNIIPDIIKILKQNNYKSKKTKIYIRPFLKVTEDGFVSDGGQKAIDEAKRELVVAEEWLDSLDAYLSSLSNDYSNWETAAKNAGITPAVLLEKANSGDTNSSLMDNSEQVIQYGLPDTIDLLFVYRVREIALLRNPQEFDQFVKRLP